MGGACTKDAKPQRVGGTPGSKAGTRKAADPKDAEPLTFKILIIGDPAVGKTALLQRFTDNTFSDDPVNTIGSEFKEKDCEFDDYKAKFQVWDTAGQEKFRTITSSYYRGAHGIIVVFDFSRKDTFTNVGKWLEQIEKYSNDDVQRILVGNKTDRDDMAITVDEAKEFAKDKGLDFFDASAKQNKNVEKLFSELGKQIKNNLESSAS